MNGAELREMDRVVHEALYPNDAIERGNNTWSRVQQGVPMASYFIVRGGKAVPVPHYTTDIMAWEPVYELHPEWWWNMQECDGAVTEAHLFVDHHMVDYGRVYSCTHGRGLRAYALARTFCILHWKCGVSYGELFEKGAIDEKR